MRNRFVHRAVVVVAVVLSLLGAVASPAPARTSSGPVDRVVHLIWP